MRVLEEYYFCMIIYLNTKFSKYELVLVEITPSIKGKRFVIINILIFYTAKFQYDARNVMDCNMVYRTKWEVIVWKFEQKKLNHNALGIPITLS